MQGAPARVAECFELVIEVGPMFGYLPESKKSFVICPLASEAKVLAAFESEDLLETRNRWIRSKVDAWVAVVKTITMS